MNATRVAIEFNALYIPVDEIICNKYITDTIKSTTYSEDGVHPVTEDSKAITDE